jgi:hypothetical protein
LAALKKKSCVPFSGEENPTVLVGAHTIAFPLILVASQALPTSGTACECEKIFINYAFSTSILTAGEPRRNADLYKRLSNLFYGPQKRRSDRGTCSFGRSFD